MNQTDMMARLGKMQEQLAKAQEEIENRVAEATAGGGAVKVEITGNYEIKSLKIDPDAVDPDPEDPTIPNPNGNGRPAEGVPPEEPQDG